MKHKYTVERHARLGNRAVDVYLGRTKLPLGPKDGKMRKRKHTVTIQDAEAAMATRGGMVVLKLVEEPAPAVEVAPAKIPRMVNETATKMKSEKRPAAGKKG